MSNQVCISNLICLNTYFIIVILLVVISYVILMKQKTKSIIKKAYVDTARQLINKYPQDKRQGLYRQMYDKLEEPRREYDNRINIRTRGELPSFQNIGYVYRDESDPSYNPDEKNRLALYGRPTYEGSDTFEYYIIENDIKMKLSNNKEIYTDDKVVVKGFSGEWTAEINDYTQYRYIPYVY